MYLFITAYRVYTIEEQDLENQPQSIYMVDDDDTTCFGFNDRQAQTDLSKFGFRMNSNYNSILNINMDSVNSCTDFQREIILSTPYSSINCPINKQCALLSEDIGSNTCTVQCACREFPCQIYIRFMPESNIKICNIN